ncbi:MAG TPA: hypothetical protein VGX78_19215 [Pirellulales bacterium]|jgi:hypothetical protein|nr:hypothetical protein [Pirellulales bacterium]
MGATRVAFSELAPPVRSFLEQVRSSGSLAVDDATAGVTFRVTLVRDSSTETKQAALQVLTQLRENADQSLNKQGVSEADVDRDC